MSINLISRLWSTAEATPTELILLIALADHGDDDGNHIYPSLPYLAWKCNLEQRQVRRLVDGMEKKKWISIQRGRGRGHSHRYSIHFEVIPQKPPFERKEDKMSTFTKRAENRTSDQQNRTSDDVKQDTHVHLNVITETSLETLETKEEKETSKEKDVLVSKDLGLVGEEGSVVVGESEWPDDIPPPPDKDEFGLSDLVQALGSRTIKSLS